MTETVPELAWPNSINTYSQMRTDAQIASLLLAFTLPMRRYHWYIDPNGARHEVVEDVANDFNLPIDGQDPKPATRRRDRFSHDRHLFHALLMLTYGHMFFEQVYRYDDAARTFRLRKLAPRMPGTISEIQTAHDGGLEYIRQYPSGQSGFGAKTSLIGMQSPQIQVDRLVAYVNDQEAGHWIGLSYLRSLFKHWVRKDRLLRVDAINAERNGAGVPLAYAPPNATKDQITALSNLARSYRAGESAGGALPNGSDLRFRGVEGTLPDVLASIRYDDEQMAARFLAMFAKLGTTETGSRALGESLIDFFALGQEAVAKQYADTTNEHVIEDLVDVNYGIDEAAPLLKFEAETDKRYSVADMKALLDAGALTTDSALEAYIRARGDLPEKPEEDQRDQADEDDEDKITPFRPAARNRIKAKATTDPQAAMTVGGRTLRRNQLPHEVKASVDWDAMEQAWTSQQASLVDDWKAQVKTAQVDGLVEAIEAAETLDQLAALEAPVVGEELLGDAMFALAEESGVQAVAEAAAQGVELDPFDSELVADEIAVRASAQATVMARSISQTASQKAITVAGSELPMDEVASRVREHLEMRALRFRHLDLMRARIDVVEAVPERSTEVDTPKSHKARTVPIPRFLADELVTITVGRAPGDLVFTNSSGGMLDNTNFRRNVFSPAVRALGLDPFTPHDLRHTTASLAVSAGANVKAVQRLLGHASAAMTLDIYAALFDDDLDDVAHRLDVAHKRVRGSYSRDHLGTETADSVQLKPAITA